jgi:hypothetical protein
VLVTILGSLSSGVKDHDSAVAPRAVTLVPTSAFLLEIIRRVQPSADPSDGGPEGFGFPKDDHVIAHQNYKQLVSGFKAQSLTGLARDDDLVFG